MFTAALKNTLLTLAKHPTTLARAQQMLYYALKFPGGLKSFNRFHENLPRHQQRLFHAAFSKLFRAHPPLKFHSGWEVSFEDSVYTIPLNPSTLWLDFDTALSMNGHDTEVKATYAYLLRKARPRLFFDVGANYGTHSLLLQKAGVQTVAFEPNPTCHDYFRALMQANRCWPTLQKQGVGPRQDTLVLTYDPRETWNGGFTDTDNLPEHWETATVEVISLDTFSQKHQLWPDLVKIDTEGFELDVLEGAHELLTRQNTRFIFESRTPAERKALWDIFDRYHHELFALPFEGQRTSLTPEAFMQSSDTNFLAQPKKIKDEVLDHD